MNEKRVSSIQQESAKRGREPSCREGLVFEEPATGKPGSLDSRRLGPGPAWQAHCLQATWWCGFSVAKSCPTLVTMDCSPPGSSFHGIFQAKLLEWVAIPFSTGFDAGIYLNVLSLVPVSDANKFCPGLSPQVKFSSSARDAHSGKTIR